MDNQNQSYFKLPLFFTFACYFIWLIVPMINFFDFANITIRYRYDNIFVYHITLGSLTYYLLVYMIALYFFQKYRIYDLSKNLVRICLLITVYTLIRYVFYILEHYILSNIIFRFFDHDYIPLCLRFLEWFDIISILIILIILFKIIPFYSSVIEFNSIVIKRIHIQIYSFFLSYISLKTILLNVYAINELFDSSITVMLLFVLLTFLVWGILYKLFNIILINCFGEFDSQVKFKKLILTLLGTIFLSALISTIIVFIILMLYMPAHLNLKNKIQFYSSYFLYSFSGINLLFSLIFSRYFIKIFYSKR